MSTAAGLATPRDGRPLQHLERSYQPDHGRLKTTQDSTDYPASTGHWVDPLGYPAEQVDDAWVTDMTLDRANTPCLIRVHRRFLTMELFKGGQRLNTWTVDIGKQSAPTPSGRTFLFGSISDTAQRHSPMILPLGAHSPLWTASVAAREPSQYILGHSQRLWHPFQ